MKLKFKGIKILAAVFLIMIIAGGCKNGTKDTTARIPQNPEDKNIKKVDITDQAELEKLWQEYFYDSITSVCNIEKFNSPEEIDPFYIARFAWNKYQREQDTSKLEHLKDSSLIFLPMDKVLEYANKYFNLTTLDVSGVSSEYYDPQKKAFIISGISEKNIPSHSDHNAWTINLDKVTRNSDGTITAVIVSYDTYENKRIDSTRTLTLKEREDGSLYFVSGSWDYADIPVTVTGDCAQFDKINGFEGNIEELSMVGETGGKLILSYSPYDKKNTGALMIADPDTYTVDKSIKSDDISGFADVRQSGDRLMAYTNNKAVIISKNLEVLREIPLPKVVSDKIDRVPKYDSNGESDVFFGGYDISGDLKKLVYSDEKGMKLYDLSSNKEKLISKTVNVTDSKLIKHSYHNMPRFISGDKKIISTMTGYECSMGYTLYDMDGGSGKTVNVFTEDIWSNIHYDTGLLKMNLSVEDEKTKSRENKDMYLDFKTGKLSEIKMPDDDTSNEIRMDYLCYIGQNYGGFVTCKYDNNDSDNNIYYINRLDLKALEVVPKVITVKGSEIHILGVMENGKIVFWYSRHPGDYVICITK